MPKSVHECVNKVKIKQGEPHAWAICVASYKKKHGGKAPNMHPVALQKKTK